MPERELTAPASRWKIETALLASMAALAVVGVLAFVPPIRQNPAFHAFCDTRGVLGIRNALNVVSNLPFLVVGVAGLAWMWRQHDKLTPELRAAYAVFFASLMATALGSAYYHWSPDDQGLFWDRLPIAIGVMGLFTAILAERVGPGAAPLLVPLVLLGGGSVVYWRLTDDLRPYAIIQFLPILLIPLILWLYPARWSRGGDLIVAIGCYVVGKAFEEMDLRIYTALGQTVSGHTLKHLAAALGAWIVYRMLVRRECLAAAAPAPDRRAGG